jgi:hypothetical protein
VHLHDLEFGADTADGAVQLPGLLDVLFMVSSLLDRTLPSSYSRLQVELRMQEE